MIVPFLALMLWSACGQAPAPEVTEPLPAEPALEADAPPAPAEDVGALKAELMQHLATGEVAVSQILNPRRGVVWIEAYKDPDDPAAKPNGKVRKASRLCGEEATARLDELKAELAERVAASEPDAEQAIFDCRGQVCFHGLTEAHPRSGSYAFVSPEGKPVLEAVVRLGKPPAQPRKQRELERWVDTQLAELTSEPCPAGGR